MGQAVAQAALVAVGTIVSGGNPAVAIALAAVTLGVNLAISGLPGDKPKAAPQAGFDIIADDRRLTGRTSTAPRRLVLGEALLSGPMVMFEGTGMAKEFLHVIVPLCEGPVAAITDVQVNDEAVGPLDGSNIATTGRFAGHVRVKTRTGSLQQAADSDAIAETTPWTSAHRGRGIADVYIRNKWSVDVWPQGFRNVNARVRGRRLYDPRAAAATIVSSNTAGPSLFATVAAHGLAPGDSVWIKDHAGAVPAVAREYEVDTAPAADTFTLLDEAGQPLALSTGGSGGTVSKMLWSDNWALVVRYWLGHPATLNLPDSEVNDTATIAAANISDEQVTLTGEPAAFAPDAATDELTLSIDVTWKTGCGVTVSTTGTLPSPLAPATTYFWIRLGKRLGKLATTLENARAGIAVDLGDVGSGAHTATRQSQPRYTANGVADLPADPIGVLEDIYTAGAGIVVWTAGKYEIIAGAAVTATGTIDEGDMREGTVQLTPRRPRAELFNAARGTYVDPDKFDTRVDLPPRVSATYAAQDAGERIFRDYEFRFTNDPVAGQRLLKIALERGRQGGRLVFPAKPRKFNSAVWDVEAVSLGFLGYSGKEFRVMDWAEAEDYGIDLVLAEESAAAWDWNLGDETAIDDAPDTNLPNPFAVAQPTGFGLSTDSFTTETGDRVDRIKVSWTPPADQFVVSGGRIEVAFKKSADPTYEPSFIVDGAEAQAYIAPVAPDTDYDVRIRAVNNTGSASGWLTLTLRVGAASAGADSLRDYGLFSAAHIAEIRRGSFSEAAADTLDYGSFS